MASGSVRPAASPLEANVSADKLIDSQLSRVRRHIRITDLIAGVMIWLAGVLAFLIVMAVIDHWMIGLGIVGRCLALLALIAGSAWYLTVHVVPLLVRRINPAYAAQTIERGEPNLKNSLLNYLLLRRDNPSMHAVVYQALQQRAASDVSKIEVDQTVDRSTLIRAGYVLAGIMAVTAAYKIASPKDPFQTVRRIASPWSDIARPARVTIEGLEPGDADVIQGQSVEVSAIVRGTRGSEEIKVVYSSADGQIVNQSVELKPDSAGLRHVGKLPARGNGIQQDYVYHVSAGDATTREFRLRAVPAPIMTVEAVEYEFPAYTQRPREVVERQGDLKAIEGTRVTVRAKANQPIRNATIELMALSNGDSSKGLHDRLPMQFRSQDAWYSWRLELAADRQSLKPKFSAYQATFVNQGGLQSRDPVKHRIEVIPDLAPEIEILTPTKESVEVFESGEQVIEIRAIDPDFGLSNVQIKAVSGGREILNKPLLENSVGQSGQVIVPFKFRPRDYQLSAGSEVTYWAVAQDNRQTETSPQPNLTQTAHRTLIVVADPKAPPGKAPQDKTDSDPNAEKPSASQPMPPNQRNSDKTPPETDSNRTDPDKEPSSEKSEKDQGDKSEKGQKGSKEGQNGKNEKGESGSEQKTPSGGNSGSESSGKDSSNSNSKQGSSSDQSDSQSGEGQSGEKGSGKTKSPQPASTQPGQGGSGQEAGGKQPQQANPDNQETPSGNEPEAPGEPGAGNSSGQRTQPLHDGEVFEKTLERLKKQQSPSGDTQQPNQSPDSKEGQDAGTDQPDSKDAGPDSAQKDSSTQKDAASAKEASQKKEAQGDAKQQDGDPKSNAAKKESPQGGKSDSRQQSATKEDAAKGKDASQQPGNQKGTGQKSTGGKKGESKDSNAAEKKEKGAVEKQPGQDTQPNQEQPKADQQQKQKTPGAGDQGKSGSGQKDDTKTGSGKKSTEGDPQKKDKSDGSQSKAGETPPPNESEKPSETKGQESGDRSGDGKKGAGQGANQQGKDTSGSNTPSDQGAGAAKEPGTGEKSAKAGNDQRSEDPTGSSGNEKGPGSKKSSGSKGNTDSKGKQPSEGSKPQSNPDSQDKSQQPNSGEPGANGNSPQGNPSGGGKPGDPPPRQQPEAGEGPGADDPNLEYSRKATDMVLEYLKDQKDKPDEQLLDELGWTADDLRGFLDRWEKLKQSANEDPAARRDLDESLRGLGLRPQADKKRTGNLKSDDVRGMRESGIKSAPPSSYQEQFDAFKKGASRSAK